MASSPNVPNVRDIGIPVRAGTHIQTFAGVRADGSPTIYATVGQIAAPFFVIDIDIETGHCEKYMADVEDAQEAVSAMWSDRRKCLFAGSCYAGHLHRFDPAVRKLEDLGAINPDVPGAATFPCRIDEHPDGTLYIGSYSHCDLSRYDPDSGELTNFGRMDEDDMYFYPQCGVDGTVAGVVRMMRPHVVKEVIGEKTIQIQPKLVDQIISENTAKQVAGMMTSAVDKGLGKWMQPKGYKIAGKTGTAQVAISGHYDADKTIASFIGYAFQGAARGLPA